jgi:DNA-binding IclR family transcriptional regulator
MLSGMSDSAVPNMPTPNITTPNITTPNTAPPNIPAARNALRVLTYLASRSGPVRASTLARDLDLPRSSAYQLIAVMMDEGFVVHYPEDQAYGLSTLLPEIGTSALRTTRLGRLAGPLLERLVGGAKLPVVAHLSVLSGADVMYVSRVQGFRAPTTVSAIGVRLPAHLTATGRAMLAQLPATQVRALYPHRDDLISRHGAGPRTLAELDRILDVARASGWAREDGEITPEYASVGATALDRGGYPVAAVGLTFRSDAATDDDWSRLGAAVRETADALTARLRGR